MYDDKHKESVPVAAFSEETNSAMPCELSRSPVSTRSLCLSSGESSSRTGTMILLRKHDLRHQLATS